MNSPLDISLPCFEGPLDLLLSLVRKNELEITDLPIADITRQYLAYLHQAAQLDLDLGSEFVYMAAWLIQIKTRCLLAGDPVAAPGADPRQELVRELLDHGEIRQAVDFLKQKLEISEATWSRSPDEFLEPPSAPDEPSPNGTLNLLQILRLAQEALATAQTHDLVAPADSVSVEEMTHWLEHRMETTAPGSIEAQTLLAEQPDASHRVSLFLAMLEMAKVAQIQLEQEQAFGPIRILAKDSQMLYDTAVPSR